MRETDALHLLLLSLHFSPSSARVQRGDAAVSLTSRRVSTHFVLPHFYERCLSWFALFVLLVVRNSFNGYSAPVAYPCVALPCPFSVS